VSGDLVVSKTDPTDRRRILSVVNDSTVYETSRGAISVAKIDANYTYENTQSGGKRKTRRKKSKSRKNRKKTSHHRRKKTSYRR
jgi:hypothetical protein